MSFFEIWTIGMFFVVIATGVAYALEPLRKEIDRASVNTLVLVVSTLTPTFVLWLVTNGSLLRSLVPE